MRKGNMKNYQLTIARTPDDLARFYPVMKELRKALSFSDYMAIYKQAHATQGYEIVAIEDENQVVAVMGYRILHDYVHGKHLYIDDLVSSEFQRSRGFGKKLLQYAEQVAKELECTGLRLCTGIENELGKQFYEHQGWSLKAVVFKKKMA